MAGADWFAGFLKRNPKITVRSPESTSIARATSFNRHNVESFFTKLTEVVDRHKLQAGDIWNMDETQQFESQANLLPTRESNR